jgi:hypothetical protein
VVGSCVRSTNDSEQNEAPPIFFPRFSSLSFFPGRLQEAGKFRQK